MNKPWHQIDAYTFRWPELSSPTAQDFMVRTVEHLIEKTPRERVDYINSILPALKRPTGSVSAFDQHIVLTQLIQWCEENEDRARAAA
jgi:NADH:ubiquinone oxidoreductase subunit D